MSKRRIVRGPFSDEEQRILVQGVQAGIRVSDLNLPGRHDTQRYAWLKRLGYAPDGSELNGGTRDCRMVIWSEQDEQTLQAQIDAGKTKGELAVEGKSAHAIGVKLNTWTEEQLACLRKQVGTPFAEIKVPLKLQHQIERKLSELELHPSSRPLSRKELNALKKLIADDVDPESWTIGDRSVDFLKKEARRRKLVIVRGKTFTKGERASISRQFNRGVAPEKISVKGRDSEQVLRELRRMDLVKVENAHWDDFEKGQLREQLDEGIDVNDAVVADKKGRKRSAAAIRAQASRMGLVGDGVSRVEWPTRDRQKLILLTLRGLSPKQISNEGLGFIDRSADGVAQMKRRMRRKGILPEAKPAEADNSGNGEEVIVLPWEIAGNTLEREISRFSFGSGEGGVFRAKIPRDGITQDTTFSQLSLEPIDVFEFFALGLEQEYVTTSVGYQEIVNLRTCGELAELMVEHEMVAM